MTSQWFCFTDDESGPYSFEQLTNMARAGELRASDLIRRAHLADWKRIDEVISLTSRSEPLLKTSRRFPPACIAISSGQSFLLLPPGNKFQRRLAIVATLVILFSTAQLWWIQRSPQRFPPAPPVPLRFHAPQRLEQMRPPSNASPMMDTIPRHLPVLVPGFEDHPWLKSPTLSADLRTIVYVSYNGDLNLDDLFIAERASAEVPFTRHRVIESTVTSGREAQPTLSPDGCELIYVQLGFPSELKTIRRADRSQPFGAASPLIIQNSPVGHDSHDAPQFLNQHTLHYTTYDRRYRQRQHHLARRISTIAPWVYHRTVPMADPWPRYVLNSRGRRAYFFAADGLYITVQHPQRRQFFTPERWLENSLLGEDLTKFDDTIWISPSEEFVFFCSPGLDAQNNDDRRLWMVRL